MKLYYYCFIKSMFLSWAWLLMSCSQEDYWERTLAGPFYGEPYEQEILTQPASSLRLSPEFMLNVHWESAANFPILVLQNTEGTSEWMRTLVPRPEGKEDTQYRITQLTLNEVKTSEEGVKVKVYCNWTGGGEEAGIIYLETNYNFRSFALGW